MREPIAHPIRQHDTGRIARPVQLPILASVSHNPFAPGLPGHASTAFIHAIPGLPFGATSARALSTALRYRASLVEPGKSILGFPAHRGNGPPDRFRAPVRPRTLAAPRYDAR